jgi:hypothetical protein
MRSMVEGCVQPNSAYDLPHPSTTLRVVPLPTATPQGGLIWPQPPENRPSPFLRRLSLQPPLPPERIAVHHLYPCGDEFVA